jgi:hypothetical protein
MYLQDVGKSGMLKTAVYVIFIKRQLEFNFVNYRV